MPTVESVLEDIGRLSPEDKRRLVDYLLIEDLGDPPNAKSDEEWMEELARRIANPEPTIDWETARKQMFRRD
jgi:hypothetical protein